MSGEYTSGSIDTLTELAVRVPFGFTTGGRSTVHVRGRITPGDWGAVRQARYVAAPIGTADGISLVDAPGGGQWVFDDARGGRVNVKWAGAVGDGVADDTAALKAAAALIQARGSGTLVVPPGDYRVVGAFPGSTTMPFTGVDGFVLEASGARFVSTDFNDSEWWQTSFTISGTTVTATTAVPHNLVVGSTVCVKDVTVSGYQGTFTVASTPSPNTFTYSTFFQLPTLPGTGLSLRSHISNYLFWFSGCRNIDLGELHFSGTVLPRENQYRMGWVAVLVRDATQIMRGHIDVRGAAYGLWAGNYDYDDGVDCTGYTLKVSAENVGYPISLNGGGSHSTYEINGNELHRGAYAAGVTGVRLRMAVKNWDIAGVLLRGQPIGSTGPTPVQRGCSDVEIDFTDTGTTGGIQLSLIGGSRNIFVMGPYDIAVPCVFRDIRVRIAAKDVKYAYPFYLILPNTQHRIDGLRLSGYIDNSGLSDAADEIRSDMYVDLSPASSGTLSRVSIEDLTVIQPPDFDAGRYNATFKAAYMDDDLYVKNYVSAQSRNFQLPLGRRVASVPAFPTFDAPSAEEFALQSLPGGAALNSSAIVATLAASVGAGDFTCQWVGRCPDAGVNGSLFSVGPSSAGAASGGFAVSAWSGDLVVRVFGASISEYREALVPDWQARHSGRITAISLVRSGSTLRVFEDGHEVEYVETSVGSGGTWADSFTTTYAVLGKSDTGSDYSGVVHRFVIWTYDRAGDFPALALAAGSGLIGTGDATPFIDASTNNGSFETPGVDGFDVWEETAFAPSAISASADAHDGSVSCSLDVGAGNEFVSVGQTGMTIGAAYKVSFWAKIASGSDGAALAVVGPVTGEQILYLVGFNWQQFSFAAVWGASSITIKRADGAGRSILIDDVVVQKVGVVVDLDLTDGMEDRVTGLVPGYSGSDNTRVSVRGSGVSDTRGDAGATLRPGRDALHQSWNSTLTADRTVTCATVGARRGDRFNVFRYGGGAFNLTITTTPTDTVLAQNTWASVVFDGTSWVCVARGWLTTGIPASSITSGTVDAARLGTGTSGTTKFLRGGAVVGSWDTIAGGDITSGTVAAVRLGSGTPGASNFLRGDGAWSGITASNVSGAFPSGLLLTYTVPGTPAAGVGVLYAQTLKDVKFKWPDATVSRVLLDAFTGPVQCTTTGDTTDVILRGITASPPASSTYHFVLRHDGLETGPGNTARDTKMLRTGIGTWTFTSNIVVPGTITLGGSDLQTTLNGKVATTRAVNTQYSLTGGGDLSADRTLNLVGDAASPGNHKSYATDGTGTRGWVDRIPTTRSVSTQHSLTGGGDLSADRTLNLVGDTASPGNSKYYGTDSGGTRGFHALPTTTGDVEVVFGTTGSTTVPDTELAETTLLGSVRAGESKTFGANTLTSGTILKIEACGRYSSADSDWANGVLRVRIGSSLVCTFTIVEPDNETPTDWFWDIVVWCTVTTAGASATTVMTGRMTYEYQYGAGTSYFPNLIQGVVSGTLDTTASNDVNITLDNAAGGEIEVECRHALVTRY